MEQSFTFHCFTQSSSMCWTIGRRAGQSPFLRTTGRCFGHFTYWMGLSRHSTWLNYVPLFWAITFFCRETGNTSFSNVAQDWLLSQQQVQHDGQGIRPCLQVWWSLALYGSLVRSVVHVIHFDYFSRPRHDCVQLPNWQPRASEPYHEFAWLY